MHAIRIAADRVFKYNNRDNNNAYGPDMTNHPAPQFPRLFRFKPLSAACLTLICAANAFGQGGRGINVIEPEAPTERATTAALDTEHFEVGVYTGLLSVQDFNSNPVYGLSLRYYFNEKVFIEGSTGTSETKQNNIEANEARTFNPDRDFTYTSIGAGYRVLKGRAFWGKKRKYNTGLFVQAGIENVDFAETSETGLVLTVSHKTVLTDWLAVNLDFKDHVFNRTIEQFSDDSELTHNIEIAIGLSTIF